MRPCSVCAGVFAAAFREGFRTAVCGASRRWLAALLVAGGFAAAAHAQFPSQNVTLLSRLSLADFGGFDANGNDCWGYVSASGREYALMGLEQALAVVEITDPANPVVVARISHTASLWADIKVYQDYCYVSNESGGGVQVIDLSQVDAGTVTLVRSVTQGGLSTAHNVAVDPTSGYLYTCASNIHPGLAAYDLSNPANPSFAGAWNGASVHDATVVTYTSGPYAGRQIAFCAAGGSGLVIVDVTNKNNMFVRAQRSYPGLQYTHQLWPSEDLQFLFIDDELDELNGTAATTRTIVFDISDLDNPQYLGSFTSGLPSSDHNLYVRGNVVYEANYTSGLRVFDASDPLNAVEVAWFDTFPSSDAVGFDGAWSVYPFFPSGTVIVSDMSNGLFVLDVDARLPLVEFSFPDGLPEFLVTTGQTIRVVVNGINGGVPASGTGRLHYDAGAGWADVAMTEVQPDVYDAVFPLLGCQETVEFYFSVQTTDGQTHTYPDGAPQMVLTRIAADALAIALEDDMETNTGWVVDPAGTDNATTGIWERGDPIGTAAQPEFDHSPDPASQCWFTGQGSPGGSLGENDVDNGQTTLMSPAIDLSGTSDPRIRYWRWYSNATGASPNTDVFVVDISNDNGASWVNVETVGPAGPDTAGGWIEHEFRVADFVTPTAQVRLRFIASDFAPGSIVEAAIDDLRAWEYVCSCPTDLDGNGQTDLQDLSLLLGDFGNAGANLPGDVNGDGVVDLVDLSALLAAFGTQCN